MIAKIINNASTKVRAGLEALAFRSSKFTKSRMHGKAVPLLAGGAKLIVQHEGDSHWIAVMSLGSDVKYHCYDPQGEDGVSSRARIAWNQGVLIAPSKLIGEL